MTNARGAAAQDSNSSGTSSVSSQVYILLACAVAFAPIPVGALRLVPAFESQNRFLIFYTPFICLLLLAYLFYIRDSLARLLFAQLYRFTPAYESYYRPGQWAGQRFTAARMRRGILGVLPLVLLGGSGYCVARYSDELAGAVIEVSLQQSDQEADAGEVGALPEPGGPSQLAPSQTADTTVIPSGLTADTARRVILRTTALDQVPRFGRLAAWYIGSFACAVAAIMLMALKEYALRALGLTERDLVLRRVAWDEAPD